VPATKAPLATKRLLGRVKAQRRGAQRSWSENRWAQRSRALRRKFRQSLRASIRRAASRRLRAPTNQQPGCVVTTLNKPDFVILRLGEGSRCVTACRHATGCFAPLNITNQWAEGPIEGRAFSSPKASKPCAGPQIRSSNCDCRSGGFPAADSFSEDKGRLFARRRMIAAANYSGDSTTLSRPPCAPLPGGFTAPSRKRCDNADRSVPRERRLRPR